MKHWHITLEERNGEYSYNHHIVVEAYDIVDATNISNAIAETFYTEEPSYCDEDGYYQPNNGEIVLKVTDIEPTNAEDFFKQFIRTFHLRNQTIKGGKRK